jgi:DNA-binding CsgD family transcriptional regulator
MRYNRLVELNDITDPNTFFDCLCSLGQEMGFEYTGFNTIQHRLGGGRTVVFRNNPPAGFAEAAREPDDSRRDPVMTKLYASTLPVIYDQATYVQAGCADLWEEQAVYGYRTGIAASITAPGGKHIMLGFDRRERLPTNDHALGRLIADLQLLAVHTLEPGMRLMIPSSTEPTLTDKQLEVLRWIALGKTDWETSAIMGISQRAVRAHLSAIYPKLDVGSKAQAVSRAAGLGLL